MTAKAKPTSGSTVIDGETYETETVEHLGETITIRELSRAETRAAQIGAKGKDDEINWDLATDLLVAAAHVPPVSPDAVTKYGNRKFSRVLGAYNRLNSLDEANPTPPAGSAGQTSPDGGTSESQPT